ncbi:MAG: sigma-54 dependent transcriptional regulator [Desulfomonilaceae bacterium]
MSHAKILAIDDEKNIRHLIKNELTLEGLDVTTAKSGEEGLKFFKEKSFDVVLLDIRLPKMNGIEVLRNLKQKSPRTEVIMITGYGDIQTAVQSMKLGARDYITKPFKLSELLAIVNEIVAENGKYKDLRTQHPVNPADGVPSFVGCPSKEMQEVYDLADRVADTDVTVLIQGETGVGKDVLAVRIHLNSSRKANSFVVVDCGLLTQNLAESELYGHTKGAFSGASETKQGLVEKSHEGTIFFDEIGNIEMDMQKKFLRFLETKKFRRLGETKERLVDSRIILATNLDLNDAAQKGIMRRDLFYRMDVICLRVPPLRNRAEDIALLAQHFLGLNRGSKQPREISPEALMALAEYNWPGNIRELRSVITKATIFSKSDVITPEDLPAHILTDKKPLLSPPKSLEDLEKDHIVKVLGDTGGNQSKAAEILGINRKTLYKKMHKYQLFV